VHGSHTAQRTFHARCPCETLRDALRASTAAKIERRDSGRARHCEETSSQPLVGLDTPSIVVGRFCSGVGKVTLSSHREALLTQTVPLTR
jgi:hypothetical protein